MCNFVVIVFLFVCFLQSGLCEMEQLLQKKQSKKSTKRQKRREYFSQLGVNKEWKSMLHQSSKWGGGEKWLSA